MLPTLAGVRKNMELAVRNSHFPPSLTSVGQKASIGKMVDPTQWFCTALYLQWKPNQLGIVAFFVDCVASVKKPSRAAL